MPFTIHEEAFKKQGQMIVSRPQEAVPDILPQNFAGTSGQGLPVRQIPFYEFPKLVYMHPNEPTQTIEHQNDKFETVGLEVVPTEHLTKVIACSAHFSGNPGAEKGKCHACEQLFKEALAEGWVVKPYVNNFIAGGDKRKQREALYSKKKPA